MQESSEHSQQLQRVRHRGSPAGVADPYLWQFLYRRHVLREIAAGQAEVGGDGTVPPLLPSKDSENLYWFAVGAPPSALGISTHNRALCPSNLNESNRRAGGIGHREIVTFFDQPLLWHNTPCQGILPAPGPPEPGQPFHSRPSTPTMASAVSAAARSDQNGAPGGAGAHVRPEERIRMLATQEEPMPKRIVSPGGGAARDIVPMTAKIGSPRGGAARNTVAMPAQISSPRGGAAQDRAGAATVAVAAAETDAWRRDKAAELVATATLPLPPPPPPPLAPPAASSAATVAGRKRSPSVPDMASQDRGAAGAAGVALCGDLLKKKVAVRRQRQRPEACSRTQSAPPPDSGKAAQRRTEKNKGRRPLTSAREKNAPTTRAASKRSRSRPPSRRPPRPRDSALPSRRCHTTVCASCETPPLEGEHVGLCLCCPRIFCPACLGAVNAAGMAFTTGDPDAVGLGGAAVVLDSAALLEAELAEGGVGAPDVRVVGADVSIWQCSFCDQGRDLELPPPPQTSSPPPTAKPPQPSDTSEADMLPKVHLLQELVKHDLSRWFRSPVNTRINKEYLDAVNGDYVMDLGTMMSKIGSGKKYRGKRGAAAFYVDLGRVWDNCRAYAQCDRKGKPLVPGNEAVVPGIARCAFTLEKLSKKFVNDHIPDDDHPAQWYEQSWNPFPSPNPRPHARFQTRV